MTETIGQEPTAAHSTDISDDGQLQSGVLPLWAVFAQSIGVLAPTTTLAVAIAAVALTAGDTTWLVWLVTGIGMLGISVCISWLAKRFTTTAGLQGLGAAAGGKSGGYWQGAFQLTANVVTMPGMVIGSGIYVLSFLHRMGIAESRGEAAVVYVILALLMTVVACSDVKLSARALLAMELISVTVIVILLFIVLFGGHQPVFDSDQLTLKGFNMHTLLIMVAFAVYSMAGWENAAVLGREARNPIKDIPRAMIGSVLFIAVLYVFASYVEVAGLPGKSLVGASSAPLDALSNNAGIGWFGWVIDACVAISFFSSGLGVMTSTARVFYTFGRDGVMPKIFGRTNVKHRAPYVAAIVIFVETVIVCVIAALTTSDQLNPYDYIGTLAGDALVLSYGVAVVLTVRHALRTRKLSAMLAVAALLGLAVLVLALWFGYNPFPTGAYGVVADIFVGLLVVYIVGFIGAQTIWRGWFERLGKAQAELEH